MVNKIEALSITVDTTGTYNKFLIALENNIGKVNPGEVRFVLHADEDKELYVPRDYSTKKNYNLFVNSVTVEELNNSTFAPLQSMGMLLTERVNTSGYYVVFENPYRVNLVPSPKGFTAAKNSTRGFKN